MTLKEEFIKLGYTEEDYEIIRNNYAVNQIKDETLIKKLKDNFAFLLKMGYTKEEVIKMTKNFPSIYGYSVESLRKKIDDMIALGYTKEEVIKMTKSFTPIYGLSIESMKQKIDDMISLGYTRKEVINMTKDLPAIYGYSKKNMKQKKDFYDSIGLHELVSVDPKQLIQSVNLSYARYCFYKDKGIDIDMNNYRKLFVREDQFEKSNGITKQELIEKYDYDKYEEQRKMNL